MPPNKAHKKMLVSYRGVVEQGQVRLCEPVELPEGTEVLVIPVEPGSAKVQERHLAELSPEEWKKPFDAVRAAWETSDPAPKEADLPGDEKSSALVRDVRVERAARRTWKKR
jgi:hypothetical protein